MNLLNFKPEAQRRDAKPKERLFLEHYAWLVERALGMTQGQAALAEDLVHDAFVQFLGKEIDLAGVGDIRWYLHGILRNLHLLHIRRSSRHPVHQFSLFDHDSALVGLRAWNSAEQLQSADSLVRACDFACWRKESSPAAAILILRYFHGYYPGEICTLLGARRKSIYKWIERGRAETREYMAAPFPLSATGNAERKAPPPVASPNAFLRCLRDRIFDSSKTECSILAENPGEFGVKELAHLVSCRSCLDCRSRAMGLAHVAARLADDISDHDDGRPEGRGGGATKILSLSRRRRGPPKGEILRRAYERRQELFEHRPKEISLAFDGEIHATMLVSAASNALNLSVAAKDLPDSIAVVSEQEFCFLVLDREELLRTERKVHRLQLSDDRVLEISVTPATLGPSIQMTYEDPLFSAASADVEDAELQAITNEKPILRFPYLSTEVTPGVAPRWRKRLLNLISAMNPLLTSAIALGTVAAVCFVLWLRSAPTPSPGEFLEHAEKADRATVSNKRPGVIYQKVAIRTSRRTLERTIYRDAQGIRRPRRQQLSPQDEQLKGTLANAGVNWDAPLSAEDFTTWRHQLGAAHDAVTRAAPHFLTLTTTPQGNGAVIKETLTVRDTDFRAVDRTIDLRDSGTVEIAELNYDLLPWGAVNQDWFEPVLGSTATDAPGVLPVIGIRVPHALSSLELDEAELEARVALNQLHADTGERIRLTRGGQGIEVKGVVETDARKDELVAQLSQLPHVQASILSVEELGSQPQLSPSFDGEPLHVYSGEPQSSPLEQYLREKKESLDPAASISQNLLDNALQIQQAQRHFSELATRFDEANQLPMNLQKQLAELSQSYLDTINTGLDTNTRTLHALGFDNEGPPPPESDAGDIGERIHRYQELCQELIISRTGNARSAMVIARELIDIGERIRLQTAHLSTTIPQAHE